MLPFGIPPLGVKAIDVNGVVETKPDEVLEMDVEVIGEWSAPPLTLTLEGAVDVGGKSGLLIVGAEIQGERRRRQSRART